jgi:DNA polymerase-3 subunit gamma/tau
MTPDADERLAEQARRVPPATVTQLLDLLADGLRAMKDGADARTQLELALVKAATPEVDAGTRALLARIERLERALGGNGTTAAAPSGPRTEGVPEGVLGVSDSAPPGGTPSGSGPVPSAPKDEPMATVTATVTTTTDDHTTVTATETLTGPAEGVATLVADLEHDLDGLLAVWPAVIESLRADNMALATALSHGRPVELDGRELVVAFGENDAFKRRKAESDARAIGDAVRTVAGAPVRLRFEVRDLREAESTSEGAAGPPTEEELVARFVSEFDAEEIDPEEPEA